MKVFVRTFATAVLMGTLLTACAAPAISDQTVQGEGMCGDSWQIAEKFYAANDQGDLTASQELLTDDAALVTWAEGANGYHMKATFVVGKDQVAKRLGEPGLRRIATGPGLPNFQEQNRRATGNTLRFDLMPDRKRENGRPYNHYSVELVFKGCRIEIIKVVERVTWL